MNAIVRQDGLQSPVDNNPMLQQRSVGKEQRKSQFYKQHQQSLSVKRGEPKEDGKCKEYGDPEYVCFKIKHLEFFTTAALFAKHSQYFNKVLNNVMDQHQAEEFKEEAEINMKQIVIRLTKTTLPSILLIIVKYIQNEFFFDSSLDMDTCFHLARVADELKMRDLEQNLLCKVILQMVNKNNVVGLLNTTFAKVAEKKLQYREELVVVENDSDSDDSSDNSRKARKKARRRRRRQNSNESGQESDSDSNNSGSSCEDISENSGSGSDQEEKAPKVVQMKLPIDKNDCIDELKDSEENWIELRDYCIDQAAQNLNYIMTMKEQELINNVKPEILDQIIEKNIQFYRGNPHQDNRSLIELLKRLRSCNSVFQLLKHERIKITEEQKRIQKEVQDGTFIREPILTWQVNNLTNYFYKQSDSVQIEGAHWRLALSYFKKQSTCLKADIKIMNSPFDIKRAKGYYKKHELSVPANLDLQKIDPMAQFEVEEVDIELQQHRVNQLNAAAANYTNHAFVSFVASVDLFENKPPNESKIYSMICSQKQPVQLLSVENFDVASIDGDSINVSLAFKVKEMYSQLLSFISKNFTYLTSEPEIRFLTKDDFKLLLKHKYLNVSQEDEVIKSICLWLEGQTLMLKQRRYINAPKVSLGMMQAPSDGQSSQYDNLIKDYLHNENQSNSVTEMQDIVSDLNEILSCVNWDYVTLPCLLDLVRTEPLFRKCDALYTAIKAQFNVRMDNDSIEAIEAAHNQFNCEPRFCYKFNTSQRNLYTNIEEIQAQGRDLVKAISGSKSQFQLLYPVQMYPDFIAHLIDCMLNPMEIVRDSSNLISNAVGAPGIVQPINQNMPMVVKDAVGSNENKQAQRKRNLQQQLMKKQLEMKHIEDQLNAIELLDELSLPKNKRGQLPQNNLQNHQNQNLQIQEESKVQKSNKNQSLAERIAQAKSLFKIQVEEHQKKQEGAQSNRLHLNENGESENSSQSGSESKSQVDLNEASDEDPDPQLDESSSEKSEVSMFKVDENNQGNKYKPKRRLSDAVEEQKQVDRSNHSQSNRSQSNNSRSNHSKSNNSKGSKIMSARGAQKNKIIPPQPKNHHSARVSGNPVDNNINNISINSSSMQSDSSFVSESVIQQRQDQANSVSDYAQLQAQRKNWSAQSSMQQAFQGSVSSQSLNHSSRDDSGSESSIQEQERIGLNSAPNVDRYQDQKEKLQDQRQIMFNSDQDCKESKAKIHANSGFTISVESQDNLKLNETIRMRESQQMSSGIPLSDCLPDGQLKQHVSHSLSNIQKFDFSNRVIEIVPEESEQNMISKEAQTDDLQKEDKKSTDSLIVVPPKVKIIMSTPAQTEVDMMFMGDLLEQMRQKEQLEQQLEKVQAKLMQLTKAEKSHQHSQTEMKELAEIGVTCDLMVEPQPVVVVPEVLPKANVKPQLPLSRTNMASFEICKFRSIDQTVDLLDQNSSFFKSSDSVSSQEMQSLVSHRVEDPSDQNINTYGESSRPASERIMRQPNESGQLSNLQLNDIQFHDHHNGRRRGRNAQQNNDGDDRLNANIPSEDENSGSNRELQAEENQIKDLTFDIFSPQKSALKDLSSRSKQQKPDSDQSESLYLMKEEEDSVSSREEEISVQQRSSDSVSVDAAILRVQACHQEESQRQGLGEAILKRSSQEQDKDGSESIESIERINIHLPDKIMFTSGPKIGPSDEDEDDQDALKESEFDSSDQDSEQSSQINPPDLSEAIERLARERQIYQQNEQVSDSPSEQSQEDPLRNFLEKQPNSILPAANLSNKVKNSKVQQPSPTPKNAKQKKSASKSKPKFQSQTSKPGQSALHQSTGQSKQASASANKRNSITPKGTQTNKLKKNTFNSNSATSNYKPVVEKFVPSFQRNAKSTNKAASRMRSRSDEESKLVLNNKLEINPSHQVYAGDGIISKIEIKTTNEQVAQQTLGAVRGVELPRTVRNSENPKVTEYGLKPSLQSSMTNREKQQQNQQLSKFLVKHGMGQNNNANQSNNNNIVNSQAKPGNNNNNNKKQQSRKASKEKTTRPKSTNKKATGGSNEKGGMTTPPVRFNKKDQEKNQQQQFTEQADMSSAYVKISGGVVCEKIVQGGEQMFAGEKIEEPNNNTLLLKESMVFDSHEKHEEKKQEEEKSEDPEESEDIQLGDNGKLIVSPFVQRTQSDMINFSRLSCLKMPVYQKESFDTEEHKQPIENIGCRIPFYPPAMMDVEIEESESGEQSESGSSEHIRLPHIQIKKLDRIVQPRSGSNFDMLLPSSSQGGLNSMISVGTPSSVNQSLLKNDLFSKKDRKLACFNILDHLRQDISPQASRIAAAPQEMRNEIYLDQMRESHIQAASRQSNQTDQSSMQN